MHTVVILDDATVCTAGVNDDGALGRETAMEESGDSQGIPDEQNPALFGKVDLPVGASRPVQTVATDSGSFVLTEDGSVYGWGTFRNEHGVFGFNPTSQKQLRPTLVYKPRGRHAPPVVKLGAGGNHVVAILKVSSVFTFA